MIGTLIAASSVVAGIICLAVILVVVITNPLVGFGCIAVTVLIAWFIWKLQPRQLTSWEEDK